jgi:outer membrane protein assembly factor BamB
MQCLRLLAFCQLLLALTPLAAAPEAPPATGWPQFLGPARNGVSAETGLLKTWPKDGPPVVWEREVGPGYSGVVISGGKLILFHQQEEEEVVEALEAATGKPVWKFNYDTHFHDTFGKGDGPRSTPLVADDRVVTLGAEGRLHCLELKTGKKLWEHALADEYHPPQAFFGVGTSPLLEGDRVLVNVGGKGAGIVAFNLADGKEVWKATDQGASYSSPVAATIDGVRHAFFFTREGLVSLDPKDGAERFSKRWRSRINASVNAATPVLADNHLFLSASYGTGAIVLHVHKDKVEEVWKGDASLSNHYDTSIYHDGFLYGIDGRQEQGAQLRCVEFKSGKVRWTQEGFGCASLLLADGRIVALTEDGDLVSFEPDPEGYREKSRARVLGKPCRAPLALADGKLYARDSKKLVCWNLKK